MAHSAERSSVRTTRPEGSASLIVSATGAAATTPSQPPDSPSRQPSTSSRLISGRAASWTTATEASGAAARASRTDSEREAPPSTRSAPSKPAGTATTTRSHTASRTSRLQSRSDRPPQTANALGPEAPRRSPLPAAGTIPTTAMTMRLLGGRGSALSLRVRLLDQVVDVLLGFPLFHLEGVHQLRGEDLLRPSEHLLLAGRETLVVLPDRQVAHDLCELEHVAG